MRHLVASQHGLYGKFYIAFVANESSRFVQMRRRVRAAIGIAADGSPIAQLILSLLNFNNGQRR